MAMPTVVIATVIGAVVGGVIILLVLATLVSVAVGMACKRKVSTNNSVKSVGALYEDLDGTEAVRTYETINEVDHNKQPIFEFFDELPTLVPTIVAHSPGQGFESLYNGEGGGQSIVVSQDRDAPTVCSNGLQCQPYIEPSQSISSFRMEGDTPLSQSPVPHLPARPNQSSSSMLLASHSSSPQPPSWLEQRPPHLAPSILSDACGARSPSLPSRLESGSPGEEGEEAEQVVRPPMPIPRGTPLSSRKSSPAATHTTPPCAHPPGYPYSYVSRGDLLVAVRTGSGTFSAHNSPDSSQRCSRENSVSRSSPTPHHNNHAPHHGSPTPHHGSPASQPGSSERLVAHQSSFVSLGCQTLD